MSTSHMHMQIQFNVSMMEELPLYDLLCGEPKS